MILTIKQSEIDTLAAYCKAAAEWDDGAESLEPLEKLCKEIGETINRRGGIDEMLAVYELLPPSVGKRSLEFVWDGIGEWRG